MPVETLEVDARVSKTASWEKTGGSSLVDALTDGSDATFARSKTPRVRCTFSVEDPTPPDGTLVAVCPSVRAKKEGVKTARVFVSTHSKGTIVSTGVYLTIPHGHSAGDHELAAHQGAHHLGYVVIPPRLPNTRIHTTSYPAKVPLTVDYAALSLVDVSSASDRAVVYEAALKTYYLLPPTIVEIVSPVGEYTDTQCPQFSVTIGVVVETWQLPTDEPPWLCGGVIEFELYRASDVPGGATIPPAGVDPLWSSEIEFIEDTYGDGVNPTEQTVTYDPDDAFQLENDEYLLFARAARELPDGISFTRSAWSLSEFEVNVALPTTPTLTCTPNDSTQCVELVVTAAETNGYDGTMTATVERSRDDGDTWEQVRGTTDFPVESGYNALGDDYEGVRGESTLYRASIRDVLTQDGTVLTSDFSNTENVTGYAVEGWNLKAVGSPLTSWIGAPVLSEPAAQREQEVGIFRPLGRTAAVAVTAVSASESGTLEISAYGADQIEALKAIIAWEGALYLETAFGEELYIRATGAGWTLRGTDGSPRRRASLSYTEIGRPAV